MTPKDARHKLAGLGVEPPAYHSVRKLRGDTFCIFAGDPEYIDRAASALRKAGFWAKVDAITAVASMLQFNVAGTEWQDGMIPENLAALPLRPEPPRQLSLFEDKE